MAVYVLYAFRQFLLAKLFLRCVATVPWMSLVRAVFPEILKT
jgi:hypothetical protein